MISGRGKDAAHREPVDELVLGQPAVRVHGRLLEEGDDREGAAEGQQAGLQPLPEDLRRERDA